MTFNFYLSSKESTKNINLTITENNFTYSFRTILRIPEPDWDAKKQRPKNIYLKKYKKLNNRIDRLKTIISAYINNQKDQGKQIKQRSLSREIHKVCTEKQISYHEESLLNFMQRYIQSKNGIICNSTYKRYKVFFNLIQRFEGTMMSQLMIQDVNSEFIKKILSFGQEELYSENTIYRTIHFVKTILNYAERQGIRTSVRDLDIKREKQKKEIISLTEDDLLKIKHTEVPNELEPAKDWLVISCFTGQRFSDFMKFSQEKLLDVQGKTCIKFIQQKTKKEILLPLHPVVLNILQKNNGYFPKALDIKKYNQDIKRVAEMAGLDNILRANKRIGHRVKNILVEKWQAITSHIGRRTFATNFYGRIPTPLLMEATGHSTEQIFMKYINAFDKERIILLGNHFDDIYKKMTA
ncbi:phage integrase SAM-like domain-containing protein [Elizabethkingia bruuniana]|uniref:phage integrase SAM-like domain-containing protein n=1 Tax=Elizabethkingia bruuniana TaxID=1756149 RepID=UPI00241E3A5A|nr:phage integrase SAM-like domain-containing protein [Elizabethkingia bruuniana]